ncbi:hypothetical protein CDO87_05705 [Sagittula sp. P11]|uniref:hypothetical protein n=1 Tax=Sagittula sp. P11 TaxID=2009329 RepID=UPI000C2CEE27|nr:hypothetical protein [Sagittula sp. P11]AUC52718.1 hypothetical protein CDO87_05705 [Sagittula sp. P11]
MHPVDELAQLRAQMRRLKAREAELRAQVLSGNAPPISNRHRVEIVRQRRPDFVKDKLPEHVLNDPWYWETRETQVVKVVDLARRGGGWAEVDSVLET